MEKPTKKYKKALDRQREFFFRDGDPSSFLELLERMKLAYTGRDCIIEKVRGKVVTHTVDDFYLDVQATASYLLKTGLGNSHLAIVGENSYSWLVALFAVTCCRAVAVPIDKELTDAEIAKLCAKGDCDGVFFSRAYKEAAFECRQGKDFRCICMNDSSCDDYEGLRDIIEREKSEIAENGFDSSVFSAKPEDVAVIVFTSGTTGENKGVVLTHKNIISNAQSLVKVIEPVYSAMSVLPMNHTYELTCCILPALSLNAVLYINDSLRRFAKNFAEFKPEAMACVPLVMDTLYDKIIKAAKSSGNLETLNKTVDLCEKLLKFGIDLRGPLFSSVRAGFGGYRFPMISVGGAPVNGERARFLKVLGFNLYIGYGLTEASPIVAVNDHVLKNRESVGRCIDSIECKIIDPDSDGIGEIAIRGSSVFTTYYKDEAATKASFADGWFLTGDYGKLDSDGDLYICGRKKNLIILDNGKNIYTEVLEAYYVDNCPLINEAVVFEHNHTSGDENVKIIALAVSTNEELCEGMSDEQVEREISETVLKLNEALPAYKRAADVMVVRHEFEKTSTMKIVRKKVEEEYRLHAENKEKANA